MVDFLIIGAQRGGTQSFYDYLLQHPHIVPAVRPDIHYFDQHYDLELSWYLEQFPLLSGYYGSSRPADHLTGEASPGYLHHPLAPERVKKHFPKMKMIVLLRNPTDRAYSHFREATRNGFESLHFPMALRLEAKRLERGNFKMQDNPLHVAERNIVNSYISNGLYFRQVQRWMKHFSSKQFFIIKSEDYFNDPLPLVREAYQFLGLTPYTPSYLEPPPVHPFERLTPKTRDQIDRVFRKNIEELRRFLKWKSAWDTPATNTIVN